MRARAGATEVRSAHPLLPPMAHGTFQAVHKHSDARSAIVKCVAGCARCGVAHTCHSSREFLDKLAPLFQVHGSSCRIFHR